MSAHKGGCSASDLPDNITPIEANLPHAVGPVVCANCGHRAISARPAEIKGPLECPECGEMAMVERSRWDEPRTINPGRPMNRAEFEAFCRDMHRLVKAGEASPDEPR